MKLIKKIAQMVVCVLVFFACITISVQAQEKEDASMDMYIFDVYESYMEVFDTTETLYISERIPVFSLDDASVQRWIYLIYNDRNVIGNIYVDNIDEEIKEYTSSMTIYDESIDISNYKNIEIMFISSDENNERNMAMLFRCDGVISYHKIGGLLENVDTSNLVNSWTLLKAKYEYKNKVNINEKSSALTNRVSAIYSSRAITNQPIVEGGAGGGQVLTSQLNVKVVRNLSINSGTGNGVNDGICWAAASASMLNYKCGLNLKAMDIYNHLFEQYGGIPDGDPKWVARAFYEFADIEVKSYRLGFSSERVKKMIVSSEKPIYAALDWYKKMNGRYVYDGKHAIVIAGYKETSAGRVLYYIIDSNENNGYWIAVNSSAKNDASQLYFSTPYGIMLKNWYFSIHY